MRITDSIRIYGHSRVDLAISTTAAHTAVFAQGVYDLKSDVDAWVKVDPTADNVTVAAGANAGYPLLANNGVPFDVRDGDKIGAVTTGTTTGTLTIHRVG